MNTPETQLFDFDHEHPDLEVLREEVARMVEGAEDEEIRIIYRVIKALMR